MVFLSEFQWQVMILLLKLMLHDATQILNNVRFSRFMLTGFDNTSTIRFGTFDLVRSGWRKYSKEIYSNSVTSDSEGNVSRKIIQILKWEV